MLSASSCKTASSVLRVARKRSTSATALCQVVYSLNEIALNALGEISRLSASCNDPIEQAVHVR